MCGPPPWSFPLPSAGSPVDCTAARTAKGFPVGGKVSSGCGRFGRGSLNNRNSDELYTKLRSRSISDSLEPRKHRYLRLGEQVARVPLALYVHLSSRNLGSSGVSVGCCLGEDAKLAAAPLAQGPFSRPREAATEGAPPARHGGWGARATRRNSRCNGARRLARAGTALWRGYLPEEGLRAVFRADAADAAGAAAAGRLRSRGCRARRDESGRASRGRPGSGFQTPAPGLGGERKG